MARDQRRRELVAPVLDQLPERRGVESTFLMRALLTFLAALAVVLMTTAGFAASPERRVALVIGNAGYQHFAGLPNPRNDAEDVTAALRRLGFTVVDGPDLTKREMDRKMA